MIYYVVYSELGGAIIKSGQCTDDMLGSQPDYTQSQNVLIDPTGTANDGLHYVTFPSGTPTITAKIPLLSVITDWNKSTILNNKIDTATLGAGDLPIGTTITVTPPRPADITLESPTPPPPIIVNDGLFSFRSSLAGVYRITASCFPYIDYTTTITVLSNGS